MNASIHPKCFSKWSLGLLLLTVVCLSTNAYLTFLLGKYTNTIPTTTSWFNLDPSKVVIVQFEGRELWKELYVGPNTTQYIPTIYNTASTWNYLYSIRHGHEYIQYYFGKTANGCRSHGDLPLYETWCKLRAMRQVQADFPRAEYFLYMDTDAVVDYQFRDRSLLDLLQNMTTEWLPDWNIDERPFALNQEGPGMWCGMVHEGNFSHCLNTGTILWKRSRESTSIMEHWWMSADDPYDSKELNPLGIPFREGSTEADWHPTDQAKAQSLLRPPFRQYVQVVSQPGQLAQTKAPCLSDCWIPHNGKLGCFIMHYCGKNKKPKEIGISEYGRHIGEHLKKRGRRISTGCYRRAVLESSDDEIQLSTEFDTALCRMELFGSDL